MISKFKPYSVVKATVEHIQSIADNMREMDKKEVWLSHRLTPYEALEKSLAISERAWTGIWKGTPAMMFGVASSGALGLMGTPWALGTKVLEKEALFSFLRESREWVEKMRDGYIMLSNMVYANNILSVRWLTWCGFDFEPNYFFIDGEPFLKFTMEGKV